MQTDNYRSLLYDTLKCLISVNETLFSTMIDLSMQGDLKEWNETVPVGETHQFDFELFKNSGDTNIQLLAALIEKVDATYETIRNINGLESDELTG